MSAKMQGYSTIGTNNKEAAETFYDGLLAQMNAIKFPSERSHYHVDVGR